MKIDLYDDFLSIFVLIYSDFHLVDLYTYENYNKLFKIEIKNINNNFFDFLHVSVVKNKFIVIRKKKNQYLDFFIDILNENSSWIENSKTYKNMSHYKIKTDFRNHLRLLFSLIIETWLRDNTNFDKQLSYFKQNNLTSYLVLSTLLKWFRWDMNLLQWVKYNNLLIKKYPNISSFYTWRVRNVFFHYIQKVLWHELYYKLLENNKQKLLSSYYMKLIFYDLEKSKKLNKNNYITYMFEWHIYLYLWDDKWIWILKWLKWKISDSLYSKDVLVWIWNYYLWKKDYELAEKYLLNSDIKDNFRFYRKIIPVYILSWQKNKLISIFNELINKWYKIFLFNRKHDVEWSYLLGENYIKNEDMNIPIDIWHETFKSIVELIWKKSINVDSSMLFYKYFRKNYNKYFLDDCNYSLIFQK